MPGRNVRRAGPEHFVQLVFGPARELEQLVCVPEPARLEHRIPALQPDVESREEVGDGVIQACGVLLRAGVRVTSKLVSASTGAQRRTESGSALGTGPALGPVSFLGPSQGPGGQTPGAGHSASFAGMGFAELRRADWGCVCGAARVSLQVCRRNNLATHQSVPGRRGRGALRAQRRVDVLVVAARVVHGARGVPHRAADGGRRAREARGDRGVAVLVRGEDARGGALVALELLAGRRRTVGGGWRGRGRGDGRGYRADAALYRGILGADVLVDVLVVVRDHVLHRVAVVEGLGDSRRGAVQPRCDRGGGDAVGEEDAGQRALAAIELRAAPAGG